MMSKSSPKKKRKLPKSLTDRSDRDVMERVFGKRAMREIDTLVSKVSDAKDEQQSSTNEEASRILCICHVHDHEQYPRP